MAQFKADVDILTANDSGPRPANVPLFVVHTFEGNPNISADDMARYQLSPAAGGSYTGVIDRRGRTARENDDNYIPWSAMPTGNRLGRHWSLAGRAAQSRAEWLEQLPQLTALARVIAHDAAEYGTKLKKLTTGEVFRARNDWSIRGVCGHADISKAFGESDHWDPGPNFPYDVVLDLAADIQAGAYPGTTTITEEDMNVEQLNRIEQKCDLILDQLAGPRNKDGIQTYAGWPQGGGRSLYDLTAAIAEVEGVPNTKDTKE